MRMSRIILFTYDEDDRRDTKKKPRNHNIYTKIYRR